MTGDSLDRAATEARPLIELAADALSREMYGLRLADVTSPRLKAAARRRARIAVEPLLAEVERLSDWNDGLQRDLDATRAAVSRLGQQLHDAEDERDELQADRDRQSDWNDADSWLRDQHARFHSEPGNMLGKNDCEWERCQFWEVANWVSNAPHPAEAERDVLRQQLASVEALHRQGGYDCTACHTPWPCPTSQALAARPAAAAVPVQPERFEGLHDDYCDEPKCEGPCNCSLAVQPEPQKTAARCGKRYWQWPGDRSDLCRMPRQHVGSCGDE